MTLKIHEPTIQEKIRYIRAEPQLVLTFRELLDDFFARGASFEDAGTTREEFFDILRQGIIDVLRTERTKRIVEDPAEAYKDLSYEKYSWIRKQIESHPKELCDLKAHLDGLESRERAAALGEIYDKRYVAEFMSEKLAREDAQRLLELIGKYDFTEQELKMNPSQLAALYGQAERTIQSEGKFN